MQQAKWVDNLVFRASYGLQGNIDKNTSPFLLGTYRSESILPGVSEDVIIINSAPNKKLRWEKTQSVNAGFDFSVLNQAINLSVDYYYRKGTDLIALRMLPLETGFTSMNVNWASMENKGVEISLSTRNITTKNFSRTQISILPITVIKVLPENITHTLGTGKSTSHQYDISSDSSQCFYHNSHYLSANVHYFSLFLLHLPQNN